MTDKKFTDDEIIKALELRSKLDLSFEECNKCPYKGECGTKDGNMPADALTLINRQKAEIERLHSEVKEKTETIDFLKDQAVGWSIDFCNLKAKLNTAKSEAIKEFADRLKPKLSYYDEVYVDNLVKEMTETK